MDKSPDKIQRDRDYWWINVVENPRLRVVVWKERRRELGDHLLLKQGTLVFYAESAWMMRVEHWNKRKVTAESRSRHSLRSRVVFVFTWTDFYYSLSFPQFYFRSWSVNFCLPWLNRFAFRFFWTEDFDRILISNCYLLVTFFFLWTVICIRALVLFFYFFQLFKQLLSFCGVIRKRDVFCNTHSSLLHAKEREIFS